MNSLVIKILQGTVWVEDGVVPFLSLMCSGGGDEAVPCLARGDCSITELLQFLREQAPAQGAFSVEASGVWGVRFLVLLGVSLRKPSWWQFTVRGLNRDWTV